MNLDVMARKGRTLLSLLRSENGFSRTAGAIKALAQKKAYMESERLGNVGIGGGHLAHVALYGFGNAGDMVLTHCVRQAMQLALPVREWELINIHDDVTRSEIDLINSCDKLIVGGGGLFLPDTHENAISGWQWAISREDLFRIAVPICVFSVGYNYFRGQKPNTLFVESLNALAEKAAFFGLRNMGSVNAVRRLVLPQLRDKIVWQPCTTTLISRLFKDSLPKKKETGFIAVNVAFDREERRYGKDGGEDVLSQLAAAVKAIEEKGYKIYYVCHCNDDDRFIPYLKRRKVRYAPVFLSGQLPNKVFEFYNKMDLVIGMRGHAQMIPFGLNCEIMSLGTHDKTGWFLQDINALDWNVELQENQKNLQDVILEKFASIHEANRDETKRRLLDAQNMLFDVTFRNLDTIKKL